MFSFSSFIYCYFLVRFLHLLESGLKNGRRLAGWEDFLHTAWLLYSCQSPAGKTLYNIADLNTSCSVFQIFRQSQFWRSCIQDRKTVVFSFDNHFSVFWTEQLYPLYEPSVDVLHCISSAYHIAHVLCWCFLIRKMAQDDQQKQNAKCSERSSELIGC